MILKVYDLFDTCNSGGWITKGATQYKLVARVKRYTSDGDIVTKVPPALFGFRHVGENNLLKGKVEQGEDSWLVFLSRHSPSVYRQRLAGR